MIKFVKNFLGAFLLWSDILVIGFHAAISVVFFYAGTYAYTMAKAYYAIIDLPENYQEFMVVFGWIYASISNIEIVKTIGLSWLYFCLCGIAFTMSILVGHEALVRLRVRLG